MASPVDVGVAAAGHKFAARTAIDAIRGRGAQHSASKVAGPRGSSGRFTAQPAWPVSDERTAFPGTILEARGRWPSPPPPTSNRGAQHPQRPAELLEGEARNLGHIVDRGSKHGPGWRPVMSLRFFVEGCNPTARRAADLVEEASAY